MINTELIRDERAIQRVMWAALGFCSNGHKQDISASTEMIIMKAKEYAKDMDKVLFTAHKLKVLAIASLISFNYNRETRALLLVDLMRGHQPHKSLCSK